MSNGSKMPQGEYQPTYGSSLLLDGFDFDSEYGEGPASSRSDPQLPQSQNGLSALPDGFLTGRAACGEDFLQDGLEDVGEEGGLGDLGGLMKLGSPMLTDLSWWEDAEQDPDRLPHSTNDTMIPELVEAWGVDRRTDGLTEVHRERPPPPPKSETSRLPGDQLREIVASSMRKSAQGVPFESIVRDVALHLGDDMRHVPTDPRLQRLAHALRIIHAEHGVAGKVYLRDNAFPGILTGKWDQVVKRRYAAAPYWLTTPGSKLAAYPSYLGKQVVTSIPWKDALEKFRPALELSGRRVASGDPRKALLGALAQAAPVAAPKVAGVPVTALVDTVTLAEAWKVFANAPMPVQQVLTPKDRSLDLARAQIAKWASSGLLSREDAARILKSGLEAPSLVKVGAARIAASGKVVTYMGQGVGLTPHAPDSGKDAAWASRQNAHLARLDLERARAVVEGYKKSGQLTAKEAQVLLASSLEPKEMVRVATARARDLNRPQELPKIDHKRYGGTTFTANARVEMPKHDHKWAASVEADLKKEAALKAREVVHGMVKAGNLTAKDAARILASDLAPKEMVTMASARANAILQNHIIPRVDVRTYSDTPYTRNVALASPQQPSENVRMVDGILRWASQQMSSGAAGQELDHLLRGRFSKELLRTASEPLVQLRRKHEGLAGHLYVDASAYATPTGVAGCEKGGLAHRGTPVQAVLKMDRCGSCVHNIRGACQKYGKILVASAPTPDPIQYQKETIRLANSEDHERTASLFHRGYDASEFGLQNETLEDISFDEFADDDTLNDVLYDGFVIPEED